jgi:hypothetical protein
VLHGQSNAWAIDYDNAYNDNNLPADAQWVRTIGAMHVYHEQAIYPEVENTDWYLASGKAPDIREGAELVGSGMVGVLGMNIGMNLVASQGVPIAVINGAGGGGDISFYQKTHPADLDVPYGRLQYRLEASGLKNHIKAFIWNQGESNAGDAVIDYKKALNHLYKDLKTDFQFEKFYIIQTPPGCHSPSGHQTVREAQRQFAEEHKNVRIMTRHGFPLNPKRPDGNYFISDGCHYHAHGYEMLAHWISKLSEYDFYDGITDFQAPQLIGVRLKSSRSVSVEFDKAITIQPEQTLEGVGYTVKDHLFAINKIKMSISELKIDPTTPNKVILTVTGKPVAKGDALTYILGDTYPKTALPYIGPWFVDRVTGVGVVGFTAVIK